VGILNVQGNALAEAQWPQNRMLRGETITGADPALILARYADGAEEVFSVTGGPIFEGGKIAGAVVFRAQAGAC
jgi:hypothetical protein